MMKKDCSMEEIQARLSEPFPSKDIEWRVSRSGNSNGKNWAMVLAYVDNRAIQNRLDEVFGPAGWKNEFTDFMQGILCTISCFVDGEWVSKSDGAEQTQFESLKGGLSGAMKRAAVHWGIGRYLYKLTETYVEVTDRKQPGSVYINDKKTNVKGHWMPPQLPDWALPENERKGKGNQSKPNSQSQTNQSSKQQNSSQSQQGNNKPSGNSGQANQNKQNTKDDSPEIRRRAAVNIIVEFLTTTGLKESPQWILPLFKRVNPGLKHNDLSAALKHASTDELKLYYNALRPVNDLVELTKTFKVSLDDSLRYAQILLPQVKVQNLFSLFTHLKIEHVKEISEFIREDLKNGQIEKIA